MKQFFTLNLIQINCTHASSTLVINYNRDIYEIGRGGGGAEIKKRTLPMKAEEPPSLAMPTATLAGAPPGAFLKAVASESETPETVGTKSINISPKQTTSPTTFCSLLLLLFFSPCREPPLPTDEVLGDDDADPTLLAEDVFLGKPKPKEKCTIN